MSPGAAETLARHLPHLFRLRCFAPRLQAADGPLRFPAALRELYLMAYNRPLAIADITAAVTAVSRLQRLETFDLSVFRIDPLISFAPLAALPLLCRLTVLGYKAAQVAEITDAQVEQLRALPRLLQLSVKPVSTALLRRLLAQPHGLQWQDISLPRPLRQDDAALLPQLPSLTALTLTARRLDSFDFLRRLPNLLWLKCSYCDGTDAQLVDALRHCTNIFELHLNGCDGLTAAHLAELLPRLPQLESLTLRGLRIDSLSFLSQAPLTDRLNILQLIRCAQLPVAELRHVHSLRGLRELSLHDSFAERLDPNCESLMALRPPSAALPLLESFSYRHSAAVDGGQDEDEDEDEEEDGEEEEEDEEDEN